MIFVLKYQIWSLPEPHHIELQNYLFECECMKCEAQKNDPDVTSEEEEDSEEEIPAADCNAEQEPNWDYGNPSRDPV